jgi:hypothetical protein
MQGVTDIPNYEGAPAVRILYRDEAGVEDGAQFRIALRKSADGDMRFKWRKGSKATLYGRWRLPEERRRKAPSMVLAEGASDCHTLWYHGIPALGIPGANTWKDERDAAYFDGFDTIYVVIEPDQGGEAVKGRLGKSRIRDRVRLVRLGEHKDPSELHIACEGDRERFKAAWDKAIRAAEPWSEQEAREREQEADTAWAACASLAQQDNILGTFAKALAARGVAGEERAAKLLYLAFTSRVFDRPASVIVKAPSSTGKSFVAERVAEFFPAEAYLLLTAMSERALAYSDESLEHRFVVLAEASALQGDMGSYLVRSLLSEGRLIYWTNEKTAQGIVPRKIEKQGPTGLIVGTTAVSLHSENETRHISLTMTDSPDQTRAVFRVLAREARKAKSSRAAAETQLESWHALQQWLARSGEPEVDIPYAGALAELIPPVAVRLRRDFKTLLILIKSHAFLHQKQRERDDTGRVVATLADYCAVRELVADLFAEGVEASVHPLVRATVCAVTAMMEALEQRHLDTVEVSVTALAGHLGLDKSVVSRRVSVAIDKGFLRNLESRALRPARLVIGTPMPEDNAVLPTAERVVAFMANPDAGTVAPVAPVAEGGGIRPPFPSSAAPERVSSNGHAPIPDADALAAVAALVDTAAVRADDSVPLSSRMHFVRKAKRACQFESHQHLWLVRPDRLVFCSKCQPMLKVPRSRYRSWLNVVETAAEAAAAKETVQ